MTTSECEFGAGMGKSAVDYLDDFILWATRLSPEEQEVWNMLCKRKKGDIFKRGFRQEKKEKIRKEKWKSVFDKKITYDEFNPILVKSDTGHLSNKESEILNLLMLGYGFEDCASMLCLSITTIKTHVIHIYQKKQVSNLHQLMVKVYNPQLNKEQEIFNDNFKAEDVIEIRNILGGS